MTLLQLTYIVSVDNSKSFAKAAKECFITQPTLSMQIQKLESDLGVKIFDRTKQPVTPTVIGKKIIEQARILLKESQKITDLVETELGEIKGRFRLGIIPTIAPYLLPRFVEKFVKRYNNINLIFDELQTDQIVERLKKDQLDAAVLATPLNDTQISEIPIYCEPFVAYISNEHRLYKKDKIHPEDLNLKDLWLLKEGHCFRDHVINICGNLENNEQVVTTPSFEGGNIETLRKLVENNFGMTLMPYLAIKEFEDVQHLKHVRQFVDPIPQREISVVYHKTTSRKHIIDILINEIKNSIPQELLNKNPGKVYKWR